ncbi:hypothetical protein SALBM311S_08104 [Streptomyces alboniger]
MRLHRLEITAFGPFGGSQTVDFDELSAAGLFLLHGPTGAGKTSVLDAVCYALYGSVPGARQSGQGMALRSDHAAVGTRTGISLELTVAGRRLEVTRQPPWERPKKQGRPGTTVDKAQSWLREYDATAGAWKDLSRSHQEIGEEITQLLGMSREQFCQVVLLPQGDFARFLRADAEARGRLLGRLFDTHRFAEVEKRLAERRRAAEAQVRDGDAALLADAHRMQQAAGGVMELPELTPGEPGLADAVLSAAAVARSTAREQLTIADGRLTAAESAQAAAERDLTDVRELADCSAGAPRRGRGLRAWRSAPTRTGRRRRGWSGPARRRRWLRPWSCGRRPTANTGGPPRRRHRRVLCCATPSTGLARALGNTHGDALGDVQTEAESGIRPAAAFGEGQVDAGTEAPAPHPRAARAPGRFRRRRCRRQRRRRPGGLAGGTGRPSRLAVPSEGWPTSWPKVLTWTGRSGPTRRSGRTRRPGSPGGRRPGPDCTAVSSRRRRRRHGPNSSPCGTSPHRSGSAPHGCVISWSVTRRRPPSRPVSPGSGR